jgi:hypothetical protein
LSLPVAETMGARSRSSTTRCRPFAKLDMSIAWQKALFEGATAMRAMLRTNPIAAQRQLEAWETYSIQTLGLQAFA